MCLSACRMADFSMVSTKNIPTTDGMVLLKSGVTYKAFNFEDAVDKCIESENGGLYLTNVVIYDNFLRYKVKADVWGERK